MASSAPVLQKFNFGNKRRAGCIGDLEDKIINSFVIISPFATVPSHSPAQDGIGMKNKFLP